MGSKTAIEWCDATWNPVTGCLHGCEYCYARRIAERFAGGGYGIENGMFVAKYKEDAFQPPFVLDNEQMTKTKDNWYRKAPYPFGFQPTFHRYRLDKPKHWTKPRTIFVCSMADLFGEWVPDSWIAEVFKACEAAPQHRYLFLTKNPGRYIQIAEKDMLPRKHWYGYTATKENELWRFHHANECPCINLFVSIEPILGPIQACFSTHCPADWIIIGAETGNRKGKIEPEEAWIDYIVSECSYSGRPVFMKNSLIPIVGEQNMIRKLPWEG